MPARTSLKSLLAVAAVVLAFGALDVAHASAAAGILPPANPAADCDSQGSSVQFTLQNLDVCRAKEGIGPLLLPSNWSALTGQQQLFVLVNLERVNRGLVPVVGLSPSLDLLAAQGAAAGTDPSFPDGGFVGGGGVWFGGQTAIAADYAWMYDDGPKGLDINSDCPEGGASSSCWLHRDIILWKGTGGALIGGGGYTEGSNSDSYAFEILSGYKRAGLSFSWAHELRYFAHKPGLERIAALAHKASVNKSKKKPKPASPSSSGSSGNSGITITVG